MDEGVAEMKRTKRCSGERINQENGERRARERNKSKVEEGRAGEINSTVDRKRSSTDGNENGKREEKEIHPSDAVRGMVRG